MINYPCDPEKLLEGYPDIYDRLYKKDHATGVYAMKPFECPIDAAALNMLRERMPTRSSHTTVSLALQMHKLPKKCSALKALADQAMCMQEQTARLQIESEMAETLPGFQST